MDGVRRYRTGAALLAASAALLAGAPAAGAQVPSVGAGAPLGQSGIQLYNFSSYLSNGAGEITCPAPPAEPTPYCIAPPAPTNTNGRMERVFAFLQSRGIKHVELYGYPGHPFPGTNPGQALNVTGITNLRNLGNQYGIHFRGRHGNLNEPNWNNHIAAARLLGQDHIGEAGFPGGAGAYNTVNGALNTAALLNRLGQRSVEAGIGPAYFHNHQPEFNTRLTVNGVQHYAWEFIMDNTDPRFVSAQIDIGWAVCGLSFGTPPDTVTAHSEMERIIEKFGKRIVSFHVKDVVNLRPTCGNADQRELGLGQINFTQMFVNSKNDTKYYLAERDPVAVGGPTNFNPFVNTANSAIALKGAAAAVVSALPQSFAAVQAGATGATTPIVVTNDGDANLSVAGMTVVPEQGYPQTQDFTIVSQNCTGDPIAPAGTCTINVAFTPHSSSTVSVAYLTIDSNSDDAVERVLLAGTSAADTTPPTASIATPVNGATYALGSIVNADYSCADNDTVASCAGPVANGAPIDTSSPGPQTFTVVARDGAGNEATATATYNVAAQANGNVGGSVGATLALTLGSPATFGAIVPGVAADYTASTTANVISTAEDAALTVADPSSTATGHLVNGTFSLPQPLNVRAGTAAYQVVGGSANPTTLVSYTDPVSNDVQTIGFRQTIAATDALRTGTYSKTLTFTLSTTTP